MRHTCICSINNAHICCIPVIGLHVTRLQAYNIGLCNEKWPTVGFILKYVLHFHMKNVQKHPEFVEICAKHMQKYVKICKSLHISAYASLEIPLYVRKHAMWIFAKHAIYAAHMLAINRYSKAMLLLLHC